MKLQYPYLHEFDVVLLVILGIGILLHSSSWDMLQAVVVVGIASGLFALMNLYHEKRAYDKRVQQTKNRLTPKTNHVEPPHPWPRK